MKLNIFRNKEDTDAQRELAIILLQEGLPRYISEFRSTPFVNKRFPYGVIEEIQKRYASLTGEVLEWMDEKDKDIIERLKERGHL